MIIKGLTEEEEALRIENLDFKLNAHITELLDFFKFAVHKKNTSAVILIDGRSGQGKTTLSNQIATYCDREYGLEKVHYNPETFLEGSETKIGLSNCKPGDVIVFDEAMLISNRSALSHINRMIIQAMSMIRSKRIFIIFNVNSIFDLDKNLVLSRADVLFHVYGQNIIDRGNVMAFFKAVDGNDRLKQLYLLGKKYYDYGKPKSNFNCHFPMNFILNEADYEAQKQQGVNDFLKGLTRVTGVKSKMAVDKLIAWIINKHPDMKIKDIVEISGLSNGNVGLIMKKIREESSDKIAIPITPSVA